MSHLDEFRSIYSDFYNDVHGVRPSNLATMSIDQLNAEFDQLLRELLEEEEVHVR